MKSTNRKLHIKARLLSLTILGLIASPMVNAQDPYWYGGASFGQTQTNMELTKVVPRFQQFGLATPTIDGDNDDVGFKLTSGFRFNRNFAIEGSVFDLGKFGFRSVMVPDSNLAANIRPMGLGLDLVGFLPLSTRNSLFARVGLNHAEVSESFSARGLASHPYAKNDDKNTNYKFGVGFQHEFTPTLALRAEAERYRIDEAIGMMEDVDMYSVGVLYRFGAKAAPAPVAQAPVAAPAVAPAPAPARAPAVAPTPPAPVRITLSADSMFDFDSAALKADGRAELDKLISDLRSIDYDVITVTGHTDRIGAQAYNLELSRQRAQTVKDYLARAGSIPAAKITALGADGSSPVTRPGQCNNLAKAELIVCLQPDRRVEVEVVGTR